MASFNNYIISAIFIGLFVFALISFGVVLSNENSTNVSILDNDAINRSFVDIESQLESIKTSSESQQSGFFKDVPVIGDIGLILKSIAGFSRVFFNSVINFSKLFITLIAETIGISPIVLGGFSAIIMISLLLLVWKLYRSGV